MTITAEAVKQLRERTGAGMMECKKALVETNGDLDAAAELMRKQGLAKADKKASRVAAEGVIVVEKSADGKTGVLVEVNCETDFVARERRFPRLRAGEVAQGRAGRAAPATSRRCCARSSPSGETVDERRRALIAKIGENISVRRVALVKAPTHASARTCTRHARRRAGRARRRRRRPGARPGHARGRGQPALRHAGRCAGGRGGQGARDRHREGEDRAGQRKAKPAEIVAKMVEGRLRKSLDEIALTGQPFVKDPT